MIISLENPRHKEDAAFVRVGRVLSQCIQDRHTMERVCRCLFRARIGLYTIFTAKSIFERVKKAREEYLMRVEGDPFVFGKEEIRMALFNDYLCFVGCTVISSKLHMDMSYTNMSWTELCHFPVAQINKIERLVLDMVGFDVLVSSESILASYEEYGWEAEETKEGILSKAFWKRIYNIIMEYLTCSSGVV